MSWVAHSGETLASTSVLQLELQRVKKLASEMVALKVLQLAQELVIPWVSQLGEL